jgi:hypothetical protein
VRIFEIGALAQRRERRVVFRADVVFLFVFVFDAAFRFDALPDVRLALDFDFALGFTCSGSSL